MTAKAIRGAVPLMCVVLLLFGFSVASQTSQPSATPPDYTDPEALQRLVSGKADAYTLVDVRTPEEYSAGHIPTAINVPSTSIAEGVPAALKSDLVIVYCASGRRSAAAKKALDDQGYMWVVDFGGMTRWKGALSEGTDPGDCPCTLP